MARPNLNPATVHGAAHGSEISKLAWRGLTIVVGVAALTASAKLLIPFYPVPLTLV